jgi:hypothetical protein
MILHFLCVCVVVFASRIASIKQQLGSLQESLVDYSTVLEREPRFVPALKGMSLFVGGGGGGGDSLRKDKNCFKAAYMYMCIHKLITMVLFEGFFKFHSVQSPLHSVG